MTECDGLQLDRHLACLPVLHLEHGALLLGVWDQGVESRPPPRPRHTVPECFASFVIFKLALTEALVVGIIIQTLHGDSVFPPARILLSGYPTSVLGLLDSNLCVRVCAVHSVFFLKITNKIIKITIRKVENASHIQGANKIKNTKAVLK